MHTIYGRWYRFIRQQFYVKPDQFIRDKYNNKMIKIIKFNVSSLLLQQY